MRRRLLIVVFLLVVVAIAAPAASATTYAQTVGATPGLAGYWRLEEAGGYTLVDEVSGEQSWGGGGVDVPGATDDGGMAWEADRLGGSIRPGVWADRFAGPMTFEAWLRPQRTGEVQAAVGPYSTIGEAVGPSVVLDADGALVARMTNAAGTYTARTPPLADGGWRHVAMTFAASTLVVYVDGAVAAQATQAVGPAGNTWSELQFGIAGGTTWWRGALDEIALYSRALDPATVHAHARLGEDGIAPHTRLAQAPDVASNLAAPVFGFATEKGGSRFRCAVDGEELHECSAVMRLAKLADGRHRLTVRATDRFGLVEAQPLVYEWTVDTVAPRTLAAVKQRVVAGDEAIATFASEPGARFECRRNEADLWNPCAPGQVLGGGPEGLVVRAVDAAGNADATPVRLNLTGWIPAGTEPFTGSQGAVELQGEGLGRYECRLDGGDWTTCHGRVQLPVIALGRHSFAVRQRADGAPLLETPAVQWTTTETNAEVQLIGVQFPLIVELSARRAPRARFALNRSAPVTISVVRRGRRKIGKPVAVSGRPGANVVKLPRRIVSRLRAGRYRLDVVAGGTVRAVVPFAVVRHRR